MLTLNARLAALLVGGALVFACEHAPEPAPGMTINRAACCTEPATDRGQAEATCRARPAEELCSYTQALSCYGTDPGPEVRAEERKASDACVVACACVCAADQRACAEVP